MDVIWDLRKLWKIGGVSGPPGYVNETAEILPLDVDADVKHSMNTKRLRAGLAQVGSANSDAVVQLTAQGTRTDTTCRRDIVLNANYAKVGEYAGCARS